MIGQKDRRHTLCALVALAAMICLEGCGVGGGKASVFGKVSYKGQPVVMGSVIIRGADGQSHSTDIGPDGTYMIGDIPAGQAQLAVISLEPAPISDVKNRQDRTGRGTAGPQTSNAPKPPMDRKLWRKLPEIYESVISSGLTCDVKSPSTERNIELE